MPAFQDWVLLLPLFSVLPHARQLRRRAWSRCRKGSAVSLLPPLFVLRPPLRSQSP